MERLSATDLHTVLDVAHELGAMQEVDDLRAGVLPRLRRLVACDTASFNEIALDAGEAVVTAVDPVEVMFDGAEEIFGAYAHQNPLITAARRPDGAAVRKFSDLISARQLHGLDLYDLVYRPMDVEHQIAFALPAPSARVVGFALNRGRGRGDFSERDRRILETVRPFVVQAYENATMRARSRATVAALQATVDRGAPMHTVHPRAVGLSRREAQVLDLVADGLSNIEIARDLALSERTVAKHLEHVYGKLGVGNRTAAVARTREASMPGGSV